MVNKKMIIYKVVLEWQNRPSSVYLACGENTKKIKSTVLKNLPQTGYINKDLKAKAKYIPTCNGKNYATLKLSTFEKMPKQIISMQKDELLAYQKELCDGLNMKEHLPTKITISYEGNEFSYLCTEKDYNKIYTK